MMNIRVRIKPFSVALWLLSIASIALVIKTSDELFLDIFRNTLVESLFQRFNIGNSIIYDLSIGFLVSVIFYLLVVWFPDRQRKNLIKRNFEEQYKFFKEDTISILLGVCNKCYESDLPTKLSEQSEFKKYFKEPVSDSQKRWDTVLNGLDERVIKELLVQLEILMNEVAFVLNNVDINNKNVFSFFKRLSQAVYKLKNSTLDDDDDLKRFLWELFAGWSFIEGYREKIGRAHV
jgi:hypothetical protein